MAGKITKMLVLLALLALAGVGCSDDDQATNPTNPDTAPPVPPTNLTADYAPATGIVTIRWDANVLDRDLAGFVVDKEYLGEKITLVSTPNRAQVYQDTNVQPGVTKYYVYAVKTAGNASAPATVIVQVYRTHADDRSNAN